MHIRTWITAAVLSAFTLVPAYGQSLAGLGAINGVVKDASGAVIPGAKVVVANPENGIKRQMETNESGIFSAPSLTPGSGYELSVERSGFALYTLKADRGAGRLERDAERRARTCRHNRRR